MEKASLKELVQVFLKLGITGFGGPAAHIAMMRTEVVENRKWLTEKEFLDLIGAANLIPGPNSTELAIFIGYKLGKVPGLILSGLCFILPAFLIVLSIAVFYQQFKYFPDVSGPLMGMRAVILSILILVIGKFSKTALINWETKLLFVLSIGLAWMGVHELILIFGLGTLYALLQTAARKKLSLSLDLFLFFLKVGSVLFGSGYILIAYLQNGLVENHKWITEKVLVDAVTIGQVTPGPLFTTATFVGYQIDGFMGALVSTIGIFLPSFLLVGFISPILTLLRNSVPFRHFLDGVNAASVGLILVVIMKLSQQSVIDIPTFLICAVSFLILVKFKSLNSAYLILVGALIGKIFLLNP